MLHVDHPARRQGKSELTRRMREWAQLNGELVSDVTERGMRTEDYKLHDGRLYRLVTFVPTGDSGA